MTRPLTSTERRSNRKPQLQGTSSGFSGGDLRAFAALLIKLDSRPPVRLVTPVKK